MLRRSRSPRPGSRPCRPPGSASSTPDRGAARRVLHLVAAVLRLAAARSARAPATTPGSGEQLLPAELELWRRAWPGPTGATRRAWPAGSSGALGRRGHAARCWPPPCSTTWARSSRPGHLRPGRRHPVRAAGRRRHGHGLERDPRLHPPRRPVPAAPRARRRPARLAGSDPLTVAWAREHHLPEDEWTVARRRRPRPSRTPTTTEPSGQAGGEEADGVPGPGPASAAGDRPRLVGALGRGAACGRAGVGRQLG